MAGPELQAPRWPSSNTAPLPNATVNQGVTARAGYRMMGLDLLHSHT